MRDAEESLPTVGEIARRLDQPIHKIEYVIRARGMRPVHRAGNSRVFTEADVAIIAAQLKLTEANRQHAANPNGDHLAPEGGVA